MSHDLIETVREMMMKLNDVQAFEKERMERSARRAFFSLESFLFWVRILHKGSYFSLQI